MKRVVQSIERIGSSMRLELQYIDFDDNTAAMAKVQKLADEIGVWRYTVLRSSRRGWEGGKYPGTEEQRKPLGCYYIWLAGSINWTGDFYTCDFGKDCGVDSLGPAKYYRKDDLRSHPIVVKLRRSFGIDGELEDLCGDCPLTVKKIPS